MSSFVAYPVQVLREHTTALEAAISVCLADPGHKPVHKLRTETRRVEALLLLLALVPGLPEHRKEAATLLRALAKLRRAAGEVRDLDVHRKLLETFATDHTLVGAPSETTVSLKSASPAGKGPSRRSAESKEDGPANEALTEARNLNDSAAELRKQMGHHRDKAAAALQELLKKRQVKTARAAEDLLKVLEASEKFALPGADLLRDAESVLMRDRLLRPGKVKQLTEDELHTVRKAAKAARYVAESLPDDPALAAAAAHFEHLQEAGGQWHDALELARAARRYFGKAHNLTNAYREERNSKLDAYRAMLLAQVRPPSNHTRRKSAGKKRTTRKRAAA